MKKVCSKCKVEKDLGAFGSRGRKRSLHARSPYTAKNSACRACLSKEGPNVKWNRLAANLIRHKAGYINGTDLREQIGEPSTCYLCGEKIAGWKDAELDHVTPLSRGGKNELRNLKWSHRVCNRAKNNQTVEEFLELLQKILKNFQP